MKFWLLVEDVPLRKALGQALQGQTLPWDGWEAQLQGARPKDCLVLQAYRLEEAVTRVRRLRLLAPEAARRMRCLVLTLEPVDRLLRRLPEALIFLSPGTDLVQMPAGVEELQQAAQRIRTVEDRGWLEPFLLPRNLRWDIEMREKHRHANRLGIFHLLYGLWRAGYIQGEVYQRTLHHLRETLGRDFPELEEYIALTRMLDRENSTSTPEFRPPWGPNQEVPFKVLLIDDEAHLGWDRVLAALFTGNPNNPQERGHYRVFQGGSWELHVVNERVFQEWPQDLPGYLFPIIGAQAIRGDQAGFGYLPWDLVLLDLRLQPEDLNRELLEEITGFRLLQKIRGFDPTIPVIMLTASERAAFIHRIEQEGISGYYAKAVTEDPETSRQKAGAFVVAVDDAIRRLPLRALWHHTVRCLIRGIPQGFRYSREIVGLLKWIFQQLTQAIGGKIPCNGIILDCHRILEILRQNGNEPPPLFRKFRRVRARYVHGEPQASLPQAFPTIVYCMQVLTNQFGLQNCNCFSMKGRECGVSVSINVQEDAKKVLRQRSSHGTLKVTISTSTPFGGKETTMTMREAISRSRSRQTRGRPPGASPRRRAVGARWYLQFLKRLAKGRSVSVSGKKQRMLCQKIGEKLVEVGWPPIQWHDDRATLRRSFGPVDPL